MTEPDETLLLDCDCGRDLACPKCAGRGHIRIAGCPQKAVPAEVRAAIRAVDLLDKAGLPPVAGGSLDQTYAFTEATLLVAQIKDAYHARLKHPAP